MKRTPHPNRRSSLRSLRRKVRQDALVRRCARLRMPGLEALLKSAAWEPDHVWSALWSFARLDHQAREEKGDKLGRLLAPFADQINRLSAADFVAESMPKPFYPYVST